jgi:N-acyl-D-aspartate/D-glutamate deacylase
MLDLAITGGLIVDGTGTPGERRDVGIRDGRVVALAAPGGLGETAARTIDADGRVVAPGFIDIHTHLDAQVFWDPMLTPSSLYGITTVVAGNCGFAVAPLNNDDDADYVMRMLARVEGIPLAALQAGVPWGWSSVADYLDAVDRARPALNMAFMAGHSTIRRAVMGADAVGGTPTAAQQAQMERLLHEALAAGAIGLSSSWTASHNDGAGNPVPSRAASEAELLALCDVVRQHEGTQVEFIPCGFPDYTEALGDLMIRMSLTAQRPLNWNVLLVQSREETDRRLDISDRAAAQGARVVALAYPGIISSRVSFLGSAFDSLPNWGETMALPIEQKKVALADPAVRARLRAGLATPAAQRREIARIERHRITEGYSDVTRPHVGRTVGEVASERGADPLDVLLDLVLADDLRTAFAPPAVGDDPALWAVREDLWRDPRVIIGASDAGAHLDLLTTFDYVATFLALTRDRDGLSLERAVQRLTDVPARLYGLTGRGRLAEGWCADVVVFDPAAVAPGRVEWRDDLPAGAGRLYGEPRGIDHVVVGGVEVARGGQVTGDRPGRVLRSGRDTETVLP